MTGNNKRDYRKVKESRDGVDASTVTHRGVDSFLTKKFDFYARKRSNALVNEYAIEATNLRKKYEKELEKLSIALRKGDAEGAATIRNRLKELESEAMLIKDRVDGQISTTNILSVPLVPDLKPADELALYKDQVLRERMETAEQTQSKMPIQNNTFVDLPKDFIESEIIVDNLSIFNSYASKQRLNAKSAIIFKEDRSTGNAIFTTKITANTTSNQQERLMIAEVDYGGTDELNLTLSMRKPVDLGSEAPALGGLPGTIDYKTNNKLSIDKLTKLMETLVEQKFGGALNQVAFRQRTKNQMAEILNDIHSQGEEISSADIIIKKDNNDMVFILDTGSGSVPLTVRDVFRSKSRSL